MGGRRQDDSRAPGQLLDDHHRADGVVRDPVGGRAEQVVLEEVAFVADDDQVALDVA